MKLKILPVALLLAVGFLLLGRPPFVIAEDCNFNGTDDMTEISDDPGLDCNSNGVLDECDFTVGVHFGTPVSFSVSPDDLGPVFLLTADVDADDDLDLIIGDLGDWAMDLQVLINDGSGGFEASASYPVGASPHTVVAADFDGDGDLDLATANERAATDHVSVLFNDGTGNFSTVDNIFLGSSAADIGQELAPGGIVSGDINGDGDIDLVVTRFRSDPVFITNHVLVLSNDGTGNFTIGQSFPSDMVMDPFPYRLVMADLDGDGNLDLAVPNQKGDTVSLFRNDGNGSETFTSAGLLQPGLSPNSVIALDIDGDGDTDLVTSNGEGQSHTGSNTVSVFLNTGTGGELTEATFATPMIFDAGADPISVKAGDVDADGDIDLVVANNFDSSTVSLLVNRGNLNFSDPVAFDAGVGPRWVVFQDLDGDGKLDLAVANRANKIVSCLSNTSTSPVSEDCDGDGTPDECEDDCNSNGIPDDCDISAGTSADTNQNGAPDECDLLADNMLEDQPDPVVFDGGARALAFVGTMTATTVSEDSVWNSATFENIDAGDASQLVSEARLYLDQNGDKVFDAGDLQIGSTTFSEEDASTITFDNLMASLPANTPVTYFLVFELGDGAGGALLFPGIYLPGGWAAPLFLALCLLLLGCARRRVPAYVMSTAAALIVAGLLLPGCGGGSSGGGSGGSSGSSTPPVPRAIQMQLTSLDVTGADTGDSALIDDLPLDAWSFDA